MFEAASFGRFAFRKTVEHASLSFFTKSVAQALLPEALPETSAGDTELGYSLWLDLRILHAMGTFQPASTASEQCLTTQPAVPS